MHYVKWILAVVLPIGSAACGTTIPWRERPVVQVEAPRPVIPVECRTYPTEPEPVDVEVLPPPPNVQNWTVAPAADWAVRARRAELSGLQLEGERNSERQARVANAAVQRTCAEWARSQDQ